MQALISIAGNIFSAVFLILVNKRISVVDNFKFALVLSCFHFYISFAFCCILLFLGVFKYKPISKLENVLRISIGSLSSTLLMNLNLFNNSVGFYQMSKLSSIPCTLLIETLLRKRQQRLNFSMLSSLLLIVFGVGLFGVSDVEVNFIGTIWAILAVLATSASQVLFGPLQKELELDPLQLLFHTTPILTIGSLCMAPFFENMVELYDIQLNFSLARDVIASCLLAVLVNYTNYRVLSETSPLTYIVIGHAKTICIILLGILFFNQSIPTIKEVLGIMIALSGVSLYSYENLIQQRDRKSAASIEKQDPSISDVESGSGHGPGTNKHNNSKLQQ